MLSRRLSGAFEASGLGRGVRCGCVLTAETWRQLKADGTVRAVIVLYEQVKIASSAHDLPSARCHATVPGTDKARVCHAYSLVLKQKRCVWNAMSWFSPSALRCEQGEVLEDERVDKILEEGA